MQGLSTRIAPQSNVATNILVLKAHGSGEETPAEYLLVHFSPYTVGRRPDNDAQVACAEVSGKHATFVYQDGVWRIEDNDSTNGTFVNGKRVMQPTQVRIGDVVHFATKGYQVVPRVTGMAERAAPTKVLADSSEIKGSLDLVNILNEQKTFTYFQPIRRLVSSEIVGWESLGRALAADGPVSAGPLYWLASRNGLEVRLSQLFRDSTRFCGDCGHCWPRSNKQKLMFFNLHHEEVREQRLSTWLDQFAAATERSPWFQPVIEVPESLCCDSEELGSIVKQIRDRGMLVAYDDFGRGQSRIADLISVPPDFLKLDRELIASLGSNRIKLGLVKAVVEACRELNVRTIGEGIENREELEACLEMCIDMGQGFLLGRPSPPFELFDVERHALPTDCPFVRLDIVDRV